MLLVVMFYNLLLLTVNLNAECIVQDGVELRQAPSNKAVVSWQVRKFFPVKKIAETKYWMKVMDLDKDKHWVQKAFLTKKYHCVIVKVSETRIKKEPNESSQDKFKESALMHETFRYIGSKKDWIYVKDVYGDTGWILYRDVWVD